MKFSLNKLTMAIFLVQCYIAFVTAKQVFARQAEGSQKNVTLNREVDQMLMKLEQSVKNRNLEQFQTFFHDEFDSQAWFLRYYAQMTERQLESFVIRRFGYVEPHKSHKGNYQFKMSESRIVGDNSFLHRSFIVGTKPMPERPYAIHSMTQHGEY